MPRPYFLYRLILYYFCELLIDQTGVAGLAAGGGAGGGVASGQVWGMAWPSSPTSSWLHRALQPPGVELAAADVVCLEYRRLDYMLGAVHPRNYVPPL